MGTPSCKPSCSAAWLGPPASASRCCLHLASVLQSPAQLYDRIVSCKVGQYHTRTFQAVQFSPVVLCIDQYWKAELHGPDTLSPALCV